MHLIFFFFTLKIIHASKILFITAYFPIKESKHSNVEYKKWTKNFFDSVNNSVVVYLPKSILQSFIESNEFAQKNFSYYIMDDENNIEKVFINNEKRIFLLTKYESVSELPPIRNYSIDFDTWQHKIDPEKHIYSPELYKLYNSKVWFLNNIAKRNFFPDDILFFWIDIGTRRQKKSFGIWPCQKMVEKRFGNTNKIFFISVLKPVYIAGGYMGCYKRMCAMFSKYYYESMSLLIKTKKFAGKEQNILTDLVQKNIEIFEVISIPDIVFKKKVNKWLDAFWILLSEKHIRETYLNE